MRESETERERERGKEEVGRKVIKDAGPVLKVMVKKKIFIIIREETKLPLAGSDDLSSSTSF